MKPTLPTFLSALGSKLTSFKNLSALVVLLLFSGNLNAQLAGTTVTMSGTAISGSPFSSLAGAITAVNALTVTGPVVVTCVSGSETAPSGGYSITKTGTSVNTITIQGNGAANSIITAPLWTAGGLTDCIIRIIGGDYITIDGFKFQENSANTVTTTGATNTMTESGIGIFASSTSDGAQYNTIKNCTITLNNTYVNNVGIFSTSNQSSTNATQAAISSAGTNSFTKIYSNTISNSTYGIYIVSPVNTSAIFETGIDIGGSSAATGNTITFGNATTAAFGWTSGLSHTICAGVVIRNGAGNSVKYNTITSNNLNYAQSGGVAGVNFSQGTVISGQTYTSTVSNNVITLNNTGIYTNTGVTFGFGIATGTIVANNNTITINATPTISSSTTSAKNWGINAAYVSATSTANNNTIIINQTFSPTAASQVLDGNSKGIDFAAATGATSVTCNSNSITYNQTNSPVGAVTSTMQGALIGIDVSVVNANISVLGNTVIANRSTSMSNSGATAVTSGYFYAIMDTAVSTTTTTPLPTATIGSSGNGNTVTVKETASATGTTTFSSNTRFINVATSTSTAVVSIAYNTLNTTGGTIRSTGSTFGIHNEGTFSNGITVTQNTINIDRVGASGGCYGTYETGTPSTVGHTITNNTITFTNLAGTSTAFGIYSLGGLTAATNTKTINTNTINMSGTNSGQSIGIIIGYGNGTINNNSITINNASTDPNGIWANQTGAAAFTITGNTLSLTSNATAPTSMIGISGGAIGPFQIYSNTFSALNFTGIITTSPTVSGISVSVGTGNNIYSNAINNISIGAATSSGSPVIRAINISGGVSTNAYKNKIYGLTTAATGASTLVSGVTISGGGTTTPFNAVYNNFIGDLRASAATNTDAIRGINITSTTTLTTNNIYYNTVYITGGGGTNFGATGIFHTASATTTTATLNLRNNIIVNSCTPNGTGLAVAYRRSTGAVSELANYASTSNNNLFYAGTPGVSNLIYSDGTSTAQTIAAYKTGVFTAGTIATRETNSITENPTFTSTTGSNLGFLHIDPAVYSSTNNSAGTGTGVTDDFDAEARSGSTPDIGADEFTGSCSPTQPSSLVLTPTGSSSTTQVTARQLKC